MRLITDLHVHSYYSRATSKDLNLEGLYRWGKIKGIHVIGTGDFTHPAWFAELQEKLEPSEGGFYKLSESLAESENRWIPESVRQIPIRFCPTVEISTIFSQGGKVRKVHSVVVMPSLESAGRLNVEIAKIGNLSADGRPILGMTVRNLLALTLEVDDQAIFFPAHVWTPWFGVFGSKSGFDSLAEAFDDLVDEVRVIETGLSSDPYMNWRVGEIGQRTVISNSDAHSPSKLGREATVVECAQSYSSLSSALKTGQGIVGTIEFFPEEGKYHWDGHRSCHVLFSPGQTKQHDGMCPVCGKKLTVGVDHRIETIADRPMGYRPNEHTGVEYIVTLEEILKEIHGVKSVTKKVKAHYWQLIEKFGTEFHILRSKHIHEFKESDESRLGMAIENMRQGNITIIPGYDGVYGTVKLIDNKIS